MKCTFCNLQTETSTHSQIFYCNNHKVKVIFYNLINSISFITKNYIIYVYEGKNIILYNIGESRQIIFPYFSITPETAELAVDKLLKLKAFL